MSLGGGFWIGIYCPSHPNALLIDSYYRADAYYCSDCFNMYYSWLIFIVSSL
jgi:hypothetical protein